MAYEVPDLPYPYDALEPHIDEQTMRVHHDKHHQAYVDNANAALEGTPLADRPVEHVLTNLDFTMPTVGASGAIAGLLGAYFILFPYSRVIVVVPILFFPFFFEVPALTYLGFWALSQVFSGTLSLAQADDVRGIAWWAHVGGFITGIALHFVFIRRGRSYRRPSRDEYGIEGAWLPAGYWGKKG